MAKIQIKFEKLTPFGVVNFSKKMKIKMKIKISFYVAISCLCGSGAEVRG